MAVAHQPGKKVAAAQFAALAAAAVLGIFSLDYADFDPVLFAMFFIGSIVSDLGAQRAPASAINVSGSFLALVLAAVLIGGPYASLIGIATVLVARSRESVARHFFRQNVVAYVWYPLIAGLVFHWLAKQTGIADTDARYYLLVCSAFAVALIVNFVLIVGYSSWVDGVSFFTRAPSALIPVLPGELISALLTVGITFLYVRLGVAALALFGIVLLSYQYLLTELLISQQRELTVREKEAEASRYAAQQAAVAALGRHALEGRDVSSLANEAVTLAAATLRVPIATVLEIVPSAQSWLIRAATGVPPVFVGETIPIHGPPTEADFAVSQRDPLVVEDWSDETRFIKTPLMAHAGTRSAVIVSLDSEGERMGVLSIGLSVEHQFTADELGFMQALANVLATAMERKRAADELEHTLLELRRTNEERRQLLHRLVQAQEEERQRIAADIHDDSVQAMAVVQMRIETLRRKLEEQKQLEVVTGLQEDVSLAIERLRHLLFELTPQALEAEGLSAAMDVYLYDLKKEADIAYELKDELEAEPPHEIGLLAYRVSQEVLANVRKHAQATHVAVTLRSQENGVFVSIADNGIGFEPAETKQELGHLGLSSIRQRAEMAGGWATIDSEPGKGTKVEFWVPSQRPTIATPIAAQLPS